MSGLKELARQVLLRHRGRRADAIANKKGRTVARPAFCVLSPEGPKLVNGGFADQRSNRNTGDPVSPTEGNDMFNLTKSKCAEQEVADIPEPPRDNDIRKKIRWWIKETPDKSVTLEVTPAIASEMLAYNDRNRPISKRTVERYAADMRAGDWRYTRVPIIFSDDQRLIDGQHRLMACIESGVSFMADVAFGAPDDSFYFIDVGRKRGAGDIFAINGVPNHTMASAATRVLIAYDADSRNRRDASGNYEPTSLEQMYQAYLGYDRLQDSIHAAGQKFATNRLPYPSTAAAVHYICAHKARAAADAYFEKVATGIGFTNRKDPAYKVRDYLMRSDERLTSRAVMKALILGWNRTRTNKTLGNIDTQPDERVI